LSVFEKRGKYLPRGAKVSESDLAVIDSLLLLLDIEHHSI